MWHAHVVQRFMHALLNKKIVPPVPPPLTPPRENHSTHDTVMCSSVPHNVHAQNILYNGYFWGGKIFVSCEFLASSWKNFRGHGILCVQTPNYEVLFCG